MGPDRIKNVVDALGVGNNNLLLLLRWSARVELNQLSLIPDDETDKVAELLLKKVNNTCKTSIKRVDLQANGERYWSGVGKKYENNLKTEADLLRAELIQRVLTKV